MGSGQNAIGARQSEMRPTRGTRNGGGLLQPRPRRTDRNDQTGKRPVHQAPLSQTQSQESSVCEIEAIVDSAPVAPTTPVPRVKRRTPTKTKPTMTFLAPSISPTDSKTDGSFVENSFVVKLMQENHELLKSKYQVCCCLSENRPSGSVIDSRPSLATNLDRVDRR